MLRAELDRDGIRIEACLKLRARLTLGELELLEGLLARESYALSAQQERDLKEIEKRLGLF